jgi:cyclic beta-1,2-glucan synthetase
LELGAEELASPEFRTLCVTAALITSPQSAAKAFGCLEEYRLANRKAEGVYYGLLADLPESKSETAPGDGEALKAAEAEVERLNSKYGGGFVFLLRKRTYSERDRVYRGWERKRGAVTELIRLLKERKSGVEPFCGDPEAVKDIKYVIILDSDTRLNAGCAAELIGAIAHPLCKPVIDAETRSVAHGSGIIAPKIGVDLYAAYRSDFTRIFAGQGGLDPYGSAGSDVYQDMFGEGSFAGKGIIS